MSLDDFFGPSYFGTTSSNSIELYSYSGKLLVTDAKKSNVKDRFSICQYTECTSITGQICKFPFKYKQRIYDTCITTDDLGSHFGIPWCSIEVDDFGNHVIGKEVTCPSTCRVVNCPVGYYWLHKANYCYRVNVFYKIRKAPI